ncbi:MAG: UDP-N-acetylmuramoyl-L-alanine--D-glutamate ligase [Acidobacteriota bacterium]
MNGASTSLARKRVTVLGLGKSGVAACDLLLERGAIVKASDQKPAEAILAAPDLAARGVTLELGGHDPDTARGSDLVVISPGIREDIEPVVRARRAGIPVVSEVELASWFLRGRVIGITGSNGKTTTTALTGAVLAGAGLDARVGGNIGRPVCTLLSGATDATLHVLELSSFQLDTSPTLRCHVAVLLNVTPDHLDRYGTFDRYAASKARIFKNQRPEDVAICNADEPVTLSLSAGIPAQRHLFSSTRKPVPIARGAWLTEGGGDAAVVIAPDGVPVLAMKSSEIPLLGRHNRENVMAALLTAWAVGADLEKAAAAVRAFRPVAHRLELVAEKDGVAWVNDSKATNLDAVKTALAAIAGPVAIILGGRDKGATWSELVPLLRGRARIVLTVGEAAPIVEAALAGEVAMTRVASMRDAVAEARRATHPGDTVLLSPGCASFDMFRSYEHRGQVFAEEVRSCLAS